MSSAIVEEIRIEIRKRASPERAKRAKGYFREPIEVHGISAPQEKEIAKQFYPRVRGDLPLAVDVAGGRSSPGCLRRPPSAYGS